MHLNEGTSKINQFANPRYVTEFEQRRKLLANAVDDRTQADDVDVARVLRHTDVAQIHVLRLVQAIQK